MSDSELTLRVLRDWCGAEDLPQSATLASLWNQADGAAFLPAGAVRLIVATRAAFADRDDKRRVLFLKTADFEGDGWQIVSAADLIGFVTAHTEDRVDKVLQAWSGVGDIPDTTVKVCSLWAVNHGIPCSFGIPNLIDRLVKEFRELRITLEPADFTDTGDIQTVDDLIGAVAGSPSRPGASE